MPSQQAEAKVDFHDRRSKTLSITIPNPRVDLQQAEAVAAMDSIIASYLFLTSSGALTGIANKNPPFAQIREILT